MLRLPTLFSDRMVLQGGKRLCVWGWADCPVTVSIQGRQATAPAEEGRFQVWLPPLDFSPEETLTLQAGEETVTIRQVAVGEVWLAGGQSNMEFQMNFDADLAKVSLGEVDVRSFGVPEIASPKALERFDYGDWGFWRGNQTLEDLRYHSAVGFYFARELARSTGHVVGVVLCSWGGTSAAPWADPEELRGTPGQWWLDQYQKDTQGATPEELEEEYLSDPQSGRGKQFDDPIAHQMMMGAGRRQQEIWMSRPAPAVVHPPLQSQPGRLYETMVKPLAPYGIRGVIWYQGESDSLQPTLYRVMLTAVIHSWRKLWGEELPFYVVQLTSFIQWMGCEGSTYPQIRQEQQAVADQEPGVFVVSTMDCGARWNIHPRHKEPVGVRLAKLALQETYGVPGEAGSPRLQEIHGEPGLVTCTFTHTQDGLIWREELEGYHALAVSVNGVPCEDFWWEAQDGRMVVGSEAFQPGAQVELRYAQRDFDPVNLFSPAGFSLAPFVAQVTI